MNVKPSEVEWDLACLTMNRPAGICKIMSLKKPPFEKVRSLRFPILKN